MAVNYQHTSADGSTTLQKGDLVSVAGNYNSTLAVPGDIYRYRGNNGDIVNLGTADYTNGSLWAQVGSGELAAQDLCQCGTSDANTGDEHGTVLHVSSAALATPTAALRGASSLANNAVVVPRATRWRGT